MAGLSPILECFMESLSITSTPSTHAEFHGAVYFSKPASLGCGFLERCFLCRRKLLPSKDIYMYNGDQAFCSEECRCRQIFMNDAANTASGDY